MKRPSSLKIGTMFVQSGSTDTDPKYSRDTAYGIVLENDKIDRWCMLHVLNVRNGCITKEWVKNYSYKDIANIMKKCSVIY